MNIGVEPKYRHQRIRDPIHDIVEFKANQLDGVPWLAIQTRPFQRLRRIKQLGFSDYVYPGACHSRFAHSVGTFNTARTLISVIEKESGPNFNPYQAQVAVTAALLHDIGHGPFSHAFDSALEDASIPLPRHEDVSGMLIRSGHLRSVLEHISPDFADAVADTITRKGPASIYDAVVSSQFDADRLDYMRRDRIMAGSWHGVIDYEWLISNLQIGSVSKDASSKSYVETLVIGPKATYAAETYVLSLFQLYPTIYFHKATRGLDTMFRSAIARMVSLILTTGPESAALWEDDPMASFANMYKNGAKPTSEEYIEPFLNLDDTAVLASLARSQRSKDEILADLSGRLLKRELPKCYDVRREVTKIFRDKHETEIVTTGSDFDLFGRGAEPALDEAIEAVFLKINHEKEKRKSHWPLCDRGSRSSYKEVGQEGSPLNQIRVNDAEHLVDLGEYSSVVRAKQEFKYDRIYYKKEDKRSEEKLINDVITSVTGRRPTSATSSVS